MKSSYRDLFVWKEGVQLAIRIYELTEDFPMRGAAVSIPSNVAEGQGRTSRGEWRQFLGHARGSLFELETHLVIASGLRYISGETVDALGIQTRQLGCGLNRLIDYVKSRP